MSDLERSWRNRISLAFLSFSALLCLVAGMLPRSPATLEKYAAETPLDAER